MKSYDYDAAVWEGDIFCLGCLPDGVTDRNIAPIFANSEWDHYPVCGHCGEEHNYVGLTEDGLADVRERLESAYGDPDPDAGGEG